MNLTFLNPFLLFGIAAVTLPILIHRIAKKKPVVREFSAVRLLLKSQQITAKPQRLKHFLLLALRILAVATMVFMMSRPVLVRPGIAAFLEEGARVLIFDNSLSMGYREDRGRRYEIAKKAVQETLMEFGGRVALIPTVGAQGEQGLEWMKPEEALQALDTIPQVFGRGDPASALGSGYQQLKNLKIPKQLLIFSDMARSDWEELDLTRLGTIPEADVIFLRVGAADRDPNVRIKDVRSPEDEVVVGVPTRLEVMVSNLSDQIVTRLVEIYLGDRKVDQKSIALSPGQEGMVYFELLVEKAGWQDGEIKLSPDRLALDDVFYFTIKVFDRVSVLVIDGDPGTSLKASESYFLLSALNSGAAERSPFRTSVITAGEMARVDLQAYDIIFLLNVARPDFSRLASFLETGKPVFFFLGDRILPEVYNRFSLAPWQIRARTDLAESGETIHPGVSSADTPGFLTGLAANLKRASIQTYFRVEGTAKSLLVLGNQDPLLLASDAGKSRIFLFASSADLAWNDLPLTAAYLPFLQGLVKDAVGMTETSVDTGIQFGERFSEVGPPIQTKGFRGGAGIYRFRSPAGEVRQAVNAPAEESDLAKISDDELKKKFGAINLKVVEYVPDGLNGQRGGRNELWPVLLGLLLTVLAFEMILANVVPRFRR
ncbi:MAG: BatA and WFA domain-containing protein [Desulfobacterales bacterium]|nr:MAG: BatA and WFA domain-containing protein [Desulfobacterales bacterium]